MVMPPDVSVRPGYVGRSRVCVRSLTLFSSAAILVEILPYQTCPKTLPNSFARMPLNLPGSTTAQLVATATPTAATNGLEKLDPRFLALLQQNEVSTENMAKLGNAGCKSMALFGHVGRDEARLEAYLKSVLNLDAQARAEDIIPVAQLVIVWTACRKRAEVETEAQAQRVVNHLPPVLTAEDHSAAREALEKKLKRPVPDHRVPSENYFQRKVGEAEGKYTAEKLTEVTNLVQEEAQKKPKGQSAASSNYLDFDDAGRPTGLKSKTTDFTVPMPTNEASFKNRFEVMDHVHLMLQMRFLSNPVLATYEPGMFKDYCNDFLCGERVWAFVLRGDNDEPTASPSLRQVCNYDWNIRKLMVRLMKRNVDIKSALEQAMGDQDLRTLYFTTGFSMEANTAECKALSAPCLEEMHHNLSKGSKRQLGSDGPAQPHTHRAPRQAGRPSSSSEPKTTRRRGPTTRPRSKPSRTSAEAAQSEAAQLHSSRSRTSAEARPAKARATRARRAAARLPRAARQSPRQATSPQASTGRTRRTARCSATHFPGRRSASRTPAPSSTCAGGASTPATRATTAQTEQSQTLLPGIPGLRPRRNLPRPEGIPRCHPLRRRQRRSRFHRTLPLPEAEVSTALGSTGQQDSAVLCRARRRG